MIRIETDRLVIRESSGRDFSRIYAMLLSEQEAGRQEAAEVASSGQQDGGANVLLERFDAAAEIPSGQSLLYDVSLDEDEELEKYLAYIHTVYPVFGFGLWSVVRKETGDVIGWCGLQPIGNEDTPLGRIELGYLIDREHRRKGYAYEACYAILDFAFRRLELDEVYVQIAGRNKESRRLAMRLGFTQKSGGLWVLDSQSFPAP